jgi:hypothetical protein
MKKFVAIIFMFFSFNFYTPVFAQSIGQIAYWNAVTDNEEAPKKVNIKTENQKNFASEQKKEIASKSKPNELVGLLNILFTISFGGFMIYLLKTTWQK